MTYTQAPTSCDECSHPVDDNNTAPSCGAHRLHTHCAPAFTCHWCDLEQDGVFPC